MNPPIQHRVEASIGARNRVLLFHCARYNPLLPMVSMGVWGLADYLSRRGFPTTVIHTGLEEKLHGSFALGRYLAEDVLIAGFSLHWFPAAAEVFDLAAEVKEYSPRLYVALGGMTSSYFWQEILERYPSVDGVIRGDGEKPLLLLAQALNSGSTSFEDVPNLVWRASGRIVENEFSYLSTNEDLKGLSFGDYRSYLQNYERMTELHQDDVLIGPHSNDFSADFAMTPMFPLMTGKGCTVNCAICGGGKAAQLILNRREQCLYLDEDIIVDTVKQALDQGFRFFYVAFDPPSDRSHYLYWLRRLSEERIEVSLCFDFWHLPTRDEIDELSKHVKNLAVVFSPDTMGEETRRRIKSSRFTNEELLERVEDLYRKKIYTFIFFGFFLPHQTREELEATRLAFWELNSKYPHYVEAMIDKISTDPASPMYRDPQRYGVKLAVPDFEEFVDECRHFRFSNIHVHEVDTVPSDFRESFEFRMTCDVKVKQLLRDSVKLAVRAFPAVRDFVGFLDVFYDKDAVHELAWDADSAQAPNEAAVLNALAQEAQEAVQSSVNVLPYLPDLFRYAAAVAQVRSARLRSADPESSGSDGGILDAVPRLCSTCLTLDLDYDVFSAQRLLSTEKRFPHVVESPVQLLISQEVSGPGISLINESMYLLCEACHGNSCATVRQVLERVSGFYGTDQAERQVIEADLLEALNGMISRGWACLI